MSFHFYIFDISDYYYDDELQLILDVDDISDKSTISDSDISLEEVVSIIMYYIIIDFYLIQYL